MHEHGGAAANRGHRHHDTQSTEKGTGVELARGGSEVVVHEGHSAFQILLRETLAPQHAPQHATPAATLQQTPPATLQQPAPTATVQQRGSSSMQRPMSCSTHMLSTGTASTVAHDVSTPIQSTSIHSTLLSSTSAVYTMINEVMSNKVTALDLHNMPSPLVDSVLLDVCHALALNWSVQRVNLEGLALGKTQGALAAVVQALCHKPSIHTLSLDNNHLHGHTAARTIGTHTHPLTYKHIHTPTHLHTHTPTQPHTHTPTHPHTHTPTHPHTQTHTHSLSLTHTPSFSLFLAGARAHSLSFMCVLVVTSLSAGVLLVHTRSLKELSVAGNDLGDRATLDALMSALPLAVSLEKLDLSNNALSDQSAERVALALQHTRTCKLRVVRLGQNKIGPHGLESLLQVLRLKNGVVDTLSIGSQDVDLLLPVSISVAGRECWLTRHDDDAQSVRFVRRALTNAAILKWLERLLTLLKPVCLSEEDLAIVALMSPEQQRVYTRERQAEAEQEALLLLVEGLEVQRGHGAQLEVGDAQPHQARGLLQGLVAAAIQTRMHGLRAKLSSLTSKEGNRLRQLQNGANTEALSGVTYARYLHSMLSQDESGGVGGREKPEWREFLGKGEKELHPFPRKIATSELESVVRFVTDPEDAALLLLWFPVALPSTPDAFPMPNLPKQTPVERGKTVDGTCSFEGEAADGTTSVARRHTYLAGQGGSLNHQMSVASHSLHGHEMVDSSHGHQMGLPSIGYEMGTAIPAHGIAGSLSRVGVDEKDRAATACSGSQAGSLSLNTSDTSRTLHRSDTSLTSGASRTLNTSDTSLTLQTSDTSEIFMSPSSGLSSAGAVAQSTHAHVPLDRSVSGGGRVEGFGRVSSVAMFKSRPPLSLLPVSPEVAEHEQEGVVETFEQAAAAVALVPCLYCYSGTLCVASAPSLMSSIMPQVLYQVLCLLYRVRSCGCWVCVNKRGSYFCTGTLFIGGGARE